MVLEKVTSKLHNNAGLSIMFLSLFFINLILFNLNAEIKQFILITLSVGFFTFGCILFTSYQMLKVERYFLEIEKEKTELFQEAERRIKDNARQ